MKLIGPFEIPRLRVGLNIQEKIMNGTVSVGSWHNFNLPLSPEHRHFLAIKELARESPKPLITCNPMFLKLHPTWAIITWTCLDQLPLTANTEFTC